LNNRPDPSLEEEVPKRKKFNIFNRMYQDSKIAEDDLRVLEKPNLPNFFKFFARNFNRIFSLNLYMVFGNFPLIFLALALSGYVSNTSVAPCYSVYSSLRCVSYFDNSAAVGSLISTYGLTTDITVSTVWTYICYGLAALVIFTFGPVCVGTAYIQRSMIRGEPVFMWSDFWYAIKKNLKQALIFGVIDIFLLAMLFIDIYYYNITYSLSFTMSLMLFLSWAMLILYLIVRMYIYPMMITFDLSVFKLIKNAFSFSVLGIKRNILAVLAIAVLAVLEFMLLSIPFTFAIGVILPLIYLFGLIGFIGNYAAYPKIKEIMIDPYYKEQKPSSTS